jgi:hypothetical protein
MTLVLPLSRTISSAEKGKKAPKSAKGQSFCWCLEVKRVEEREERVVLVSMVLN